MPRAADDLEAAADYIARGSPRLAAVFVQDVIHAAERLAVFPQSGRIIPEKVAEDFREVIVHSHRVFYQVADDTVVIPAIHHSARRFPDLP